MERELCIYINKFSWKSLIFLGEEIDSPETLYYCLVSGFWGCFLYAEELFAVRRESVVDIEAIDDVPYSTADFLI